MISNNYRIYRRKQEAPPYGRVQLAVAILDTGSPVQLLESLAWYEHELNHSLVVVTQEGRFDVALLQEEHRQVTFIVFLGHGNLGQQINAVANECGTNFFLIVRSDLLLIHLDGQRLFSGHLGTTRRAAYAAVVANTHKEIIPSVRIPHLSDRMLDPKSSFPVLEGEGSTLTLYPVMGLGVYDRALFQRLRGFDEEIRSDYFQLLDWGIRCHLLGYSITSESGLLVQFEDRESIIEDRSEEPGFRRCYTKALSIRRRRKKMVVKRYSGYHDRNSYHNEVKRRLRWQAKIDFPTLVAQWPKEGA